MAKAPMARSLTLSTQNPDKRAERAKNYPVENGGVFKTTHRSILDLKGPPTNRLTVARRADRRSDAQILDIVMELLPAIQARHIAVGGFCARPMGRCDGPSQLLVMAAEQSFDKEGNHKISKKWLGEESPVRYNQCLAEY
jgi:hypothetical protein